MTLVALVGMSHRGTEEFVASLPAGEPLTLVREPTNSYDPNAVQVWARGQHIGYVKATQARQIAQRIDADAALPPGTPALTAKLRIAGGRWPMVEVDL